MHVGHALCNLTRLVNDLNRDEANQVVSHAHGTFHSKVENCVEVTFGHRKPTGVLSPESIEEQLHNIVQEVLVKLIKEV